MEFKNKAGIQPKPWETIYENINSFLTYVPDNFPDRTIPIQRELFRESLMDSENSLFNFLTKTNIEFLEELSIKNLFVWRQELSTTLSNSSQICCYIIAAKEFLKRFRQRLGADILKAIDSVPGKPKDGENEYLEKNPLYLYLEDLI